MWVPVAVWQPCELLYTCYLLTYFILCFELKLNWELDQTCDDAVISRRASLSSNDAALRVLKSTHDRHSVFQCSCFSVVCFFIYVSVRAVVSAFLSLSVRSTQFCFFTVFAVLYLCWKIKYSFIHSIVAATTGCGKKVSPLKISGNISPTTENFSTRFYAPFVRSYLIKIAKFCSIISTFGKVMPYLARSSFEFLHFARKNAINCDVPATVWSISTKFFTMMQNMSVKCTTCEKN